MNILSSSLSKWVEFEKIIDDIEPISSMSIKRSSCFFVALSSQSSSISCKFIKFKIQTQLTYKYYMYNTSFKINQYWWCSKNPIYLEMIFFSVWIVGNNIFTSIFPSPEFMKLMVGDRRPDTCKTIHFNGI